MSKPARRQPDTIRFVRPQEPGDELTVPQVVRLYLDYAVHKLAPKTFENHERYLLPFADEYHDKTMRVGSARKSDLELWIRKNGDAWKSDYTRRTIVGIIQACFNWAVTDEHTARNPYKGFSWREGEPRRPMTEEEFVTLLRNTSAIFRRVLLFSAETGARPGEMSSLTWPQIDFDKRTATLIKHKTRNRQKIKKSRVIRLSGAAVKLLLWMHKRRTNDGLVFLNTRGRVWTGQSLHQRISRLRERLGLAKDLVLYGLRHKFGTDCAEAGYNSSTTAELMGHDDPRTTEKYYIRLSGRERHLRESIDGLKKVRRRNRKDGEW